MSEPPRPDVQHDTEPIYTAEALRLLIAQTLVENDDLRAENLDLRAALTWLVDSRPWPVAECWAYAEMLLEENEIADPL